MWISFEIIITVLMTLLFGYVYLSIFIAFFIGNIRNPVGFFLIYGLHIAILISAIVAGFFIEIELFLPQIHFIILATIGVVLLPFNLYNRQKRERLQNQLELARQRIAELTIVQERERIARDLHDTLGQKLSMIGLKSDLAVRLMERDIESSKAEIQDIRQISSTALKEVRVLVSGMRRVKLKDELIRVQELLKAAEIELEVEGTPNFPDMSPIVENVLVMCLKEAINNVVRHSYANKCCIKFKQTKKYFIIKVKDNGIGIAQKGKDLPGNGLYGMEERLEFVNGSLAITSHEGTELKITVPAVLKQIKEGDNI